MMAEEKLMPTVASKLHAHADALAADPEQVDAVFQAIEDDIDTGPMIEALAMTDLAALDDPDGDLTTNLQTHPAGQSHAVVVAWLRRAAEYAEKQL